MVALARTFANGALPRPSTGDAVFFDVPVAGLVLYPESWAWPVSIAAIALVLVAMLRVARRERDWVRDVVLGAVAALVSTAAAGGLAMLAGNAIGRAHDTMGWNGAPAFRGIYTAALAALAVAIAFAGWAVARRWASAAVAHVGALVVWSVVTLLLTWKLPGVSFMFVWPLVAMAVATIAGSNAVAEVDGGLTRSRSGVAAIWVATVIAMAIVVPIVYAVSAVLLGAVGPGGIATGVLVALLAWLLAPHLETIAVGRPWLASGLALAIGLSLTVVGMATIRSSPDHPTPSQMVYALDADSADAWLSARGPIAPQLASPSSSPERPPAWVARVVGGGSVALRRVQRLPVDGPHVDLVSDSTSGGERKVTLRVRAASGSETISMRAVETRVLRSAVDGRIIETGRYRGGVRPWRLDYTAPPDSGFRLDLVVPAAASVVLEVAARTRGIPSLPDFQLPARAPDVVTVHTGDVTVVRRSVVIPSRAP
jgi:hypothetical protein